MCLICICGTSSSETLFPLCLLPYPTVVPNSTKVAEEEKKFRDCADLHQAGFNKNGVYTIQINPQETKKVGNHNILQHCNVKIYAFSSLLGRSFIMDAQGVGILKAENTLGSFVSAGGVRCETGH